MLSRVILAAFALALGGACKKPDESECKKAVINIRRIIGTTGSDSA